jgi:hypothetical protein
LVSYDFCSCTYAIWTTYLSNLSEVWFDILTLNFSPLTKLIFGKSTVNKGILCSNEYDFKPSFQINFVFTLNISSVMATLLIVMLFFVTISLLEKSPVFDKLIKLDEISKLLSNFAIKIYLVSEKEE